MRVMGGMNSLKLYLAFTNASSLHSKLRTLGNHVADDAMVDVHGMCLCASPSILWCYLYHPCIVRGNYIHIGVGFEVACLYVVGSSKAWSVR